MYFCFFFCFRPPLDNCRNHPHRDNCKTHVLQQMNLTNPRLPKLHIIWTINGRKLGILLLWYHKTVMAFLDKYAFLLFFFSPTLYLTILWLIWTQSISKLTFFLSFFFFFSKPFKVKVTKIKVGLDYTKVTKQTQFWRQKVWLNWACDFENW